MSKLLAQLTIDDSDVVVLFVTKVMITDTVTITVKFQIPTVSFGNVENHSR